MTGASSVVTEGIRLLRPGGTYVFVGMVHPDTKLDLTGEQVVRKCLTIRGIHNYGPRHLEAAVAFLDRTVNSYPYESLVGPPQRLSQIAQTLRAAEDKQYPRMALRPDSR